MSCVLPEELVARPKARDGLEQEQRTACTEEGMASGMVGSDREEEGDDGEGQGEEVMDEEGRDRESTGFGEREAELDRHREWDQESCGGIQELRHEGAQNMEDNGDMGVGVERVQGEQVWQTGEQTNELEGSDGDETPAVWKGSTEITEGTERGMHCQEGTDSDGGQEDETEIGQGGGTRYEEDGCRENS